MLRTTVEPVAAVVTAKLSFVVNCDIGIETADKSTLSVTSPVEPPPVSAVPAVTAVMSPGFEMPVQDEPS